VKNSISQIKKALIEKKISVGELYDEYLAKAKSNKYNSFNLVIDRENNISSIKDVSENYDHNINDLITYLFKNTKFHKPAE